MSGHLETVEVPSGADPALSVIWLHGLGADGHDFEPIVAELRLDVSVRFIFPHAPVRPVTINAGLPMRAWFDLYSLGAKTVEDEEGVRQAGATIETLIDRERERGMQARRVVLAGFSQGGALALHVGLRHREPLAGIMALSTYLPLADSLANERTLASARVPLFMAHGTADPIVPFALGESSRDLLLAQGYTVEWHVYAMGHGVCAAQIRDINRWLNARGRHRSQ